MQVKITVDRTSDGRDVTSLYRWLGQDPDVTGHAKVSLLPTQEQAGDMGGAFEVINAIVSNGIALGNLALACAMWRASRPSAPAVRFERDGITITVENGLPETVRQVVDALSRPEPRAAADGEGPG
ncbi:effector-associated constant component EACC1 [Streptomyces sp. NPDC054833]